MIGSRGDDPAGSAYVFSLTCAEPDDDGDGTCGDVVDVDGCSIAQLCPYEHPLGGNKWKNDGAYVSWVAHASNDFAAGGLITEAEKDAIVSAAGESVCGHKNKLVLKRSASPSSGAAERKPFSDPHFPGVMDVGLSRGRRWWRPFRLGSGV